MGFGGTTIHNDQQKISGVSIQSSAYGMPIPIVFGKTRVTGNLIGYSDFTAIPHTSSQSSGGKGGGGVTTVSTTYTYTAAVMNGLAEGPIHAIGQVWASKELTTMSALGLTLFSGTYPQTPWGFMTTNHPTQALGYSGLAYVANSALDLGGSASLPNLSFEVTGFNPYNLGTIDDANPKDVVNVLLTDANCGAGWDAARIGDLTQFSNYCVAMGIFVSPAFKDQKSAAEQVSSVLAASNTAVVWSEGVLKFIPYGDSVVTGNSVTFTPNITPVYDLTDDDFLGSGVDPIECTRKQTSDAYNQVQIEFLNRANAYNTEIAEAKDQANIDIYGLRPNSPEQVHMICDKSIAVTVAQTKLQRALYIRNVYRFKLGWRFMRLEPMDIVTLTDSRLGLLKAQVRITEIEESEDGELDVIAEEFPFGVATPALYSTQPAGGYSVNFNVSPGNANAPVIFEPPMSLSNQPEVWFSTSGGSAWGGCEVWVSLDNATYKNIGTISGNARHGTLTAALPSAADPDVTNTLAVDLSVSNGTLISGTLADRDLYNTLCYVDGELVSYQTATMTSANHYSLTSLRRGAYGSTIGSHALGTKFARLDQAVFKYAYTPDYVGKTIYVKLRSFNIYQAAHQDLSAVTPTTYAIVGAPVGAVAGFALAQPWLSSTLSVVWSAYAGADHYKIEVWVGGVLKRTVDNITATAFDYPLQMAAADGGPFRSIELHLYAKTSTGQSTTAAILVASNPQIAAPTGLSVSGAVGNISIKADTPTDADYAGTMIWAGDTAYGTGTFTALDAGHLIYDGPTPVFQYPLSGATTKHIIVAHYDKLGKDSLNPSTDTSATSVVAGGITTVNTAPGTTYLGQDVVYYGAGAGADFKLYRWNSTLATPAYIRAADGGDLTAGSVTADKVYTTSLAALTANLGAITAGNITMPNTVGNFIAGGQVGYDSGSGFYLGSNGTNYQFSIGNSAGNKLTWDGTNLNIVGGGTFSGALSAATGSFAGSLSAATGTFSGSLSAATGTFGAMTVAAGGNVKMGQTGFNTGAGFFLGDDGGVAKFSIGNPSGSYLYWDGVNLAMKGTFIDQNVYTAGGTVYSAAAQLQNYVGSLGGNVTLRTWTTNVAGSVTVSVYVAYAVGFSANGLTVDIRLNGAVQGGAYTLTQVDPTFYVLTRSFTVANGDVIAVVATPGTTNTYLNHKNFLVTKSGSYVVALDDASSTGNASATYMQRRKIQMPRGGTVTVRFNLWSSSTGGYGRVYKNGVAVGTERNVTSMTPVVFDENFTFSAGDTLELWTRNSNGGTTYTGIFEVYADQVPYSAQVFPIA